MVVVMMMASLVIIVIIFVSLPFFLLSLDPKQVNILVPASETLFPKKATT